MADKQGNKRRLIVVTHVLATRKHCMNDCPHMQEEPNGCGATFSCMLFLRSDRQPTPLTWDREKKVNGNRRLARCRNSEQGQG